MITTADVAGSAAPTRPSTGPAPCCSGTVPSSSTARQQICQGALLVTTVIRTCGIAPERDCPADGKHGSESLDPEQDFHAQESCPG